MTNLVGTEKHVAGDFRDVRKGFNFFDFVIFSSGTYRFLARYGESEKDYFFLQNLNNMSINDTFKVVFSHRNYF